MFSKIRDLERYDQDQKRFRIAIDSTDGELQEQGRQLLAELNRAIENFDNVMVSLISDHSSSKMDHATAQKVVAESKWALENWILKHAPNIHIEIAK